MVKFITNKSKCHRTFCTTFSFKNRLHRKRFIICSYFNILVLNGKFRSVLACCVCYNCVTCKRKPFVKRYVCRIRFAHLQRRRIQSDFVTRKEISATTICFLRYARTCKCTVYCCHIARCAIAVGRKAISAIFVYSVGCIIYVTTGNRPAIASCFLVFYGHIACFSHRFAVSNTITISTIATRHANVNIDIAVCIYSYIVFCKNTCYPLTCGAIVCVFGYNINACIVFNCYVPCMNTINLTVFSIRRCVNCDLCVASNNNVNVLSHYRRSAGYSPYRVCA